MFSFPLEESLTAQYLVHQTIGQGATSYVTLAEHRLTGMLVAVKIMTNEAKNLRHIYSEVGIMEGLRHSNIIRIFQILVTPRHLHIVMEYAEGGDLRRRIRLTGRLQEEEAQRVFRQIVDAVHYCHQRGIAHRDIKTSNILLDGQGNAKLSDFGLATKCKPGKWLQRRCGTYSFIPPEIFCAGPYDGMKVDVWSVGVVLFHIVTGYCPFRGKSYKELKQQICQGTYEIPAFVSKDIQDLIGKLLTIDAGERPTLGEIVEYPWLKQGEKLPSRGPSEIDTNHPDPSLLAVLSLMGYDLQKIQKSLQRREYDEYMGTYLMLEQQAEEPRHEEPEMLMSPVVAPCSTPDDQYTGLVPLKSLVSSLSLNRITLSVKHHMPKEKTSSQKTISVSIPDIALDCPDSETPSKSPANRRGAGAGPGKSSKPASEAMSLCTGSSPIGTPASLPNSIPRWKRIGKRIRACFSSLCCCLSSQKS